MEDTNDLTVNLKEKVREVLDVLQIEQERKPLRLVQQFGYLAYVRLFVESQKSEKLQPYFPYGGFPMEWTRGDEAMDDQQRIWQLQYQMQYCSSIVEEGHFMEQARAVENVGWLKKLCKLHNFRLSPSFLNTLYFRIIFLKLHVLYVICRFYSLNAYFPSLLACCCRQLRLSPQVDSGSFSCRFLRAFAAMPLL